MQTTKWELYEYQRSRSVIDLGPNHLHSIFLNFFSSITADFNTSSAIRWAIQDQWSSGFLHAAVTRAVEVEESQYMCPSSRQARCTVKPPWLAGNSQTINKHVQTDKLTLAGVELVSPGQWFAARGLADALTIWASRPANLTTVHGVCASKFNYTFA